MRPLFVSPAMCAQLLQIHRDDIYKMIDKGELPAVRFGRRIRIPMKALDALVEEAMSSSSANPLAENRRRRG